LNGHGIWIHDSITDHPALVADLAARAVDPAFIERASTPWYATMRSMTRAMTTTMDIDSIGIAGAVDARRVACG